MFFFFNHTATTEIYTLSLHDALPIYRSRNGSAKRSGTIMWLWRFMYGRTSTHDQRRAASSDEKDRSEEHTSELQSHSDLVCRLLLEKKKTNNRKSRERHMTEERSMYE